MYSDNILGFETIEKNLKAMAFKRLIYSFISILAILFLLSSGLTIAEENNAGSFQRGLSKFFDYPVDLFKEAFESGEWAIMGCCMERVRSRWACTKCEWKYYHPQDIPEYMYIGAEDI